MAGRTPGRRDERLFLYANFTSNLGNGIQIIASAYLVLVKTDSMLSVGFLFILAALPQAVLSTAAGALADRGHYKSLCVLSDLVRAACVAMIPIALLTHTFVVPTLYLATVVDALLTAVFVPAGSSWIQRLLDQENYARFSTHFEISTQAAILVSSSVGGFFLQCFSAESVFAFNALTYVASATLLGLTARPAQPAVKNGADRAVRDRSIPWRRLAPAIVMFSQNRIITTVMNTLLVVLVIKTFHQGMGVLGLIDAIAGLGFTLGALAFAPVHRRYRAAIILVAGSALSAVCIIPQPLFGIAGLAVTFVLATFVYGVSRPAARLIVMYATDDDRSGRVFGAANALGFAGGAAGTLVISGVVDTVSIEAGYLCVGGYFLAVSLLAGLPLLRQTQAEASVPAAARPQPRATPPASSAATE